MKKAITRLLLVTTLSLGLASPVLAHEFLIKPESWNNYSAGQVLPIAVYSTHTMIKGEEIEPLETVKLSYNGEAVGLTSNAAWLTQDGSITLQGGSAAIIEGHRLPMLWSETANGGADGGRSTHPDAISAASYEKFVRLILPVDGNTSGFDKVSGHRLEIVPITNPLTAKVGDELQFKVYLDGKLTAFDTVEATYDGFTDIPSAWAYSAAPVQHGHATVKITASGLWMVRVGVTIPNKTAEYDEEVLRAILIFPVQ